MLEVRDSRSGDALWTRTFEKRVPRVNVNVNAATMTFAWRLYMPGAKAELEKLPQLAEKRSSFKDGDYLVEVVDLMTGKIEGGILIDTNDGAFKLESILATKEWIAATDSYHRAVVYNVKTGKCTGKTFGSPFEIAGDSRELLISKDPRHFILVDTETMTQKSEFAFPFAVTTANLSPKGDRMFVVTEDQTIYILDTSTSRKELNVEAAK